MLVSEDRILRSRLLENRHVLDYLRWDENREERVPSSNYALKTSIENSFRFFSYCKNEPRDVLSVYILPNPARLLVPCSFKGSEETGTYASLAPESPSICYEKGEWQWVSLPIGVWLGWSGSQAAHTILYYIYITSHFPCGMLLRGRF